MIPIIIPQISGPITDLDVIIVFGFLILSIILTWLWLR